MDAISVTPFGVDFLNSGDDLYLHCIDFQLRFSCSIKSVPSLVVNLVGGHVSFVEKPRERRIALFPNNNIIRALQDERSPCLITIISCCEVEVYSNSTGKKLVIWDFNIKDNNAIRVPPCNLHEYDDATNVYPSISWLNTDHCQCNCTSYENGATIIQNYDNSSSDSSDDAEVSPDANIPSIENLTLDSRESNSDSDSIDLFDNDHDDSDDENDTITHTLPFKVIGVAHSNTTQTHLETCYEKLLAQPDSVPVKLMPEPDNEHDRHAISVQVNYDNEWHHVGYIASELTQYVHNVMHSNLLLECRIQHIRFRVNFYRPGFYMKLLLTRQGEWEPLVLHKSKSVR